MIEVGQAVSPAFYRRRNSLFDSTNMQPIGHRVTIVSMRLSCQMVLLFAPALLLASSIKIEERGEAFWPTANFLRFLQTDSTPKGRPVWIDVELPEKFNPDSVRVLPERIPFAIPAKIEWRAPKARISWVSTGARQ